MLVCSFTTENHLIKFYQDSLELSDLNFSLVPHDSTDSDLAKIWAFNIYLNDTSNKEEILAFIYDIATRSKLKKPDIEFIALDNQDWVSETQKNFRPLRVNNICIYSSYYQDIVDQNDQKTIYINIDPGNAFGTGEHHTTQACLKAISKLSNNYRFQKMLDLGCGSAVLAIAMAKIFNQPVLACDIDADAVAVAQDNINKNKTSDLVTALQADGINNPLITQYSSYDLIVCNILANVLIDLAQDIYSITSTNGIIVLSGLTIRQLENVESAYHHNHFKTIEVITQDEWCAVILQKNKD